MGVRKSVQTRLQISYSSRQSPIASGGPGAGSVSTGLAAIPRALSRQRNCLIRFNAKAVSLTMRGDHRRSATAANRGKMMPSTLEASMCSAHAAAKPPIKRGASGPFSSIPSSGSFVSEMAQNL